MHSQQLLTQIKTHLFTDPQRCIKILSSKIFLNNLFQEHLVQLTQVLENALQKVNKENKGLSFASPQSQPSVPRKSDELNAQLIVCMYSIIIMKSTSKSIIAAEQTPLFHSKLAIQTLSKIQKQIKLQDVRKIVSALLLKIPSFTNHKAIIRDVSPEFVSMKTMEKASSFFRTQCPNLFEQKLMTHKDSEWGTFLSYKPFKLDTYGQSFKKLQTTGTNSNDANALIEIREELKKEFEFLLRRIEIIKNEEFFIYEFCEKFSQLFRMRLQFSKLLEGQRFAKDSKSSGNNGKHLPSYNINQLRLKILLEGKNYLLIILSQLVKKLSSYWSRKLKWLYDFMTERIETYGLEELGLPSIQEPDIYIEKLTELKLLIKLAHTYYKQFGDGLFPEEKLKAILFTQQYSFYKLIQALLYNQYEFLYQTEGSRIVNYQKSKKVSEETKNKKTLIKTINVNSKSLNINPHYDLVFQTVIQEVTYKNGDSYTYLRQLIHEVLRFMLTYYKKSETFFYGGNLIGMIENCKNSHISNQRIVAVLKEIKTVLYPQKKMTKQGLEFFCEEVFENYISKKRLLEVSQKKNSSTFNICKTSYVTIHNTNQNQKALNISTMKIEPSPSQGVIRKTKSYDMAIEGWGQENQKGQKVNNSWKEKNPELSGKGSQIFYSIRECPNETQRNEQPKDMSLENANSKFESIQENQEAGDDFILTPEF